MGFLHRRFCSETSGSIRKYPSIRIPASLDRFNVWLQVIISYYSYNYKITVFNIIVGYILLIYFCRLSGTAAIKAKNVCLSLVDGHMDLNKSGPVQLFNYSHPARVPYNQGWGEKLPPRIVWQKEKSIYFLLLFQICTIIIL